MPNSVNLMTDLEAIERAQEWLGKQVHNDEDATPAALIAVVLYRRKQRLLDGKGAAVGLSEEQYKGNYILDYRAMKMSYKPHKNALRAKVLGIPDPLTRPRIGAPLALAGDALTGVAFGDAYFFPSIAFVGFSGAGKFNQGLKSGDCIAILRLPVHHHALTEHPQYLGDHVADGVAATNLLDMKEDVVHNAPQDNLLRYDNLALVRTTDSEKRVASNEMKSGRTAYNRPVVDPGVGDGVADVASDKASRFAVMDGHIREDARVSSLDWLQLEHRASPSACVSSQPSSLASACTAALHRESGQTVGTC